MHRDVLRPVLIAAALFFGLLTGAPSVPAQDRREIELTAQDIVARVDRILAYPRGEIKGKLLHILPDGTSTVINLMGRIAESDFLFTFSTQSRGDELRVLYNQAGEDIWVYAIHAQKLFRKMDVDKYDPLLGTNFSFIDFSNADYQANYNAVITGDALIKGRDTYRLRLDPIYKGGSYGRLTLYAAKKDYVPLRIDFHDNDKVVFKSIVVAKTMSRGNRIVPVRYDMLDLRRGTVTILEFFGFDESINFDKTIFFHQRLGEKG
ncbi:MAG TPA: outer membrane lipoprotein-sorting protein [Spirochaetota bacterium]|nr:outer membrane lipoprotein-sorting protein [Spirochaetota bacterium]